MEPACKALAPMRFGFIELLFHLPFAGDAQCTVMQGHIDVLLFHPWHFHSYHHVVAVLANVYRRPTATQPEILRPIQRRQRFVKQSIDLLSQRREMSKRIPTLE